MEAGNDHDARMDRHAKGIAIAVFSLDAAENFPYRSNP